MTEKDIQIFEKTQLQKTERRKPLKISKQALEETIEQCNGLTYDMCLALDCTPKQLYNKIDQYQLREAMTEARKQLVAQAESVVGRALKSDNEKLSIETARFILERLGRDEGWGQNPQIQQNIQVVGDAEIKGIFGI